MAHLSRKRRIATPILTNLFGAYLTLYHRCRFENVEHLPKHGPLMVIVNHVSLIELFALGYIGMRQGLHGGIDGFTIAKKEAFEVPLLVPFIRSLGFFPLDRERVDMNAMRTIVKIFKDGNILAISPEGTRSPTGHLQKFQPVIAKIAITRRVPILPAGAIGTFESMPVGAKFPKPVPVTLRFGPVFELSEFYDTALTDDQLLRAADVMRDHVAELLPEWMRQLPPENAARKFTVRTESK